METQIGSRHEETRPQPTLRTRPPRLLLAEDDDDLRRLIAPQLRAIGYQVIEAHTGTQLLERLGDALLSNDRAARPDVIVSDIRMPGFTGLEILTGLRDAHWRSAMIVMTAYADPETRARVRELEPDAFFLKPFDIDDLLTAIINLDPRSRGGRSH